MIHQHTIKLADFGLSRRLGGNSSNTQSKNMGVIPYVDPIIYDKENALQRLKFSDVYSIGVLFWEISSGQPPFKGMSSYSLIVQISQGLRETPLPDTPTAYINLYTGKYHGFSFKCY